MQVEVDPVLAEVSVAVSTVRVFMTPVLVTGGRVSLSDS